MNIQGSALFAPIKLVFVGLVVLGVMGLFSAQAAAPAEKLQQIEEQLNEKKQQQEALDAAALETSQSLLELRQKLIASTQALQEKETEQENLEDKRDTLTDEIAEKKKTAAQERKQLSLMVSALIEIAGRPPESLFLQDHATADHVNRSLLLKAILPRLKEQTETAARDLAALYDMQKQLDEQEKLITDAQTNLEKQKHDLDQLVAARQGFLRRTEAQKEEIARHLAALSTEARDLRQLMEKIVPKHSAKPAPADTVALKYPIAGSVKRGFGEKDSDGVVSEGLTLTAPSGAPIIAPRAGRIVFAGIFRGYGKIIILQHANSYHSLLAGFGRIDAEMGQEVEAGEPLGVLPVKAGSKPELYFEWRRGDKPADPRAGLEKK